MKKLFSPKSERPKITDLKSPSIKLTHTQLIVLRGAAQRGDGAAILPDSVKDKPAS